MSDEMGLVPVAWRYRGPKGGWITVEEKPTGWYSEPLYDAAAIERLVAHETELRRIISACAAALPNGAFISPKASIEFMANLPAETKACSDQLVAEVAAADLRTGAASKLALELTAERDEARAALKPFADFAPYVEMFVEGRAAFGGSPILPTKHFRKSDFDRARQALQDIER